MMDQNFMKDDFIDIVEEKKESNHHNDKAFINFKI
jgi:hypothetical protein